MHFKLKFNETERKKREIEGEIAVDRGKERARDNLRKFINFLS